MYAPLCFMVAAAFAGSLIAIESDEYPDISLPRVAAVVVMIFFMALGAILL